MPKLMASVAGDGGDPAGKFRAVPQQPQSAVTANKGFLRGFLGQRGIAEAAPGHGKDPAFMAFHELAITLGVAAPHGCHGGLIFLARPDHFNGLHLTARQPQKEIVTDFSTRGRSKGRENWKGDGNRLTD